VVDSNISYIAETAIIQYNANIRRKGPTGFLRPDDVVTDHDHRRREALMAVAEREVVTPEEHIETLTIEEIQESFRHLADDLANLARPEDQPHVAPYLVAPGGETSVAIPPSVFRILRYVVHHMARGEAISLMPVHLRLTTQEAADLLGVSRPFLIKLLDQGQIPFTKTGKHRRIKLQDVLEYEERRDREAREVLTLLAREAQEEGDYFG
jgi:excisionase family DNA binding protein